jgi:hypothetical protein
MRSIILSIKRCRAWIISVFLTYCISCAIGIVMVHQDNQFALTYRDRIVGHANRNDKASISYLSGKKYTAVLSDFSGNLLMGAIPQTVVGLGVVIPYFTVAYQGWIGGIVSVNYKHQSRLEKLKPAAYYIIVLILQFIPYSLAIGSGIKFGVETYKLNMHKKITKFNVDKASMKDVFKIYILVIPLFFLASCFEFLSNWNI